MLFNQADNDTILLYKNRTTSALHNLLSAINYKMTVKDIHHPQEKSLYNINIGPSNNYYIYNNTLHCEDCLSLIIRVNFNNKMKVYSSTKGKRQMNSSIRENVNELASLLRCTSAQSFSLSPSGSLTGEEEALNLAR
jgi:hypothetical protein